MNATRLLCCAGALLLCGCVAGAREYEVTVKNFSNEEFNSVHVSFPEFDFEFGYSGVRGGKTFCCTRAALPQEAIVTIDGREVRAVLGFDPPRKKVGTLHVVLRSATEAVLKVELASGLHQLWQERLLPDEDDPRHGLFRELDAASRDGDIARVRELLAAGAPLAWEDPCTPGPLHFASMRGHLDVVDALLEARSEQVSAARFEGSLRVAAQNGHIGIMRRLDRGQRFGPIPVGVLNHACSSDALESVRFLIGEVGMDPDSRLSEHGHTPLYVAVLKADRELLDYLLEAGATDLGSVFEQTALTLARKKGLTDFVNRLERAYQPMP